MDQGRLSARRALEALAKVRLLGVDRASAVLANAVEAAREATHARRAAAEARRAHAEHAAKRSGAEEQALESGALRAVDLLDGAAWGQHVAKEHLALAARERKATESEALAADGERRARLILLSRKVDADIVNRTLARRDAEEQQAAEAAAEQAASEAWRPRS